MTDTATPDSARFDELTCSLLKTDDPTFVLADLADLVAELVPRASGASIVQTPAGRNPRYLAATAAAARAVDETQVRLGEGPVLAAMDTPEAVIADDLTADARWPRLAARLAERPGGPRSAWAHRLCDGVGIVLTLYADEPGTFDADTIEAARLAAQRAHPVVDHWHSVNRAVNLSIALTTSRQIGAAMGVLMARRKVTEDQAFDLLRIASQQLHRKLRDVAVEVTETGALPIDLSRTSHTNGRTDGRTPARQPAAARA